MRPCLYVKGVQKFLSSFKSYGSRGSATCDRSASGHRGASRDPLVRMDQDAGLVMARIKWTKEALAKSASRYETLKEWRLSEPSAYATASRLKLPVLPNDGLFFTCCDL